MIYEHKLEPKPEFIERINLLLPDKKDREEFWKILKKQPLNSIRCNTLKMSSQELKKRLEKNQKWKILQPFKEYPEIMIIDEELLPGQIGKTKEHLLGYYYIQEISSMMPILALRPNKEDDFLDLCASPGSKTTQAASLMENKGNILANENKIHRMMILSSNLEKNGVANCIITIRNGVDLGNILRKAGITFNKILVDAPCSGEGTIRSSPKTLNMWNKNLISMFSRKQKLLCDSALKILEKDGEMIYSTCTHAPEENEEVIQYLLENHDIKILPVKLPLKTRQGLNEWNNKIFDKQIKNCVRIYPQDNDTEGFFICKLRKLGERQ